MGRHQEEERPSYARCLWNTLIVILWCVLAAGAYWAVLGSINPALVAGR